ncbi:MAG: hypothetical protein WC707_02800 [Candidatus Babeliaceae bacterium]|jgi:hypothetical protein
MRTYKIALFIFLSVPCPSFGQSWFHDMPFSPMQTGALFLGTIGLGVSGYLWSSGTAKVAIFNEDKISVLDLKKNLGDRGTDLLQLDLYKPIFISDLRKNCEAVDVSILSGVFTKINDKTILNYIDLIYFLGSKISHVSSESRMRILKTVASHAYGTGKSPYKIASCSQGSDEGFQGPELKIFTEQITYFSDKVIPKVEQDIEAYGKSGQSQQKCAIGLGIISAAAVGGVLAYNTWHK